MKDLHEIATAPAGEPMEPPVEQSPPDAARDADLARKAAAKEARAAQKAQEAAARLEAKSAAKAEEAAARLEAKNAAKAEEAAARLEAKNAAKAEEAAARLEAKNAAKEARAAQRLAEKQQRAQELAEATARVTQKAEAEKLELRQAYERLAGEANDLRRKLHLSEKAVRKALTRQAEAEQAYEELYERMRLANKEEPGPPDPYRVRVQSDRLELELYLAREPLPAGTPVYVFQHTMKTGGTSIRSLIYRNLVDRAEFERHDIPKEHPDFRALYGDFYAGFSEEQRARVWWVVSHSASHVIPYVERPVHAFTIVRESIDRVLSRFWYPMRVPRTLDHLGTLFQRMTEQETSRGAAASAKAAYSNYQSRCLLEPYYDVKRELPVTCGPPPDAELWRKRLFDLVEQTYTLLPNERLDASFARLAAGWGWSVDQAQRHRVNTWRPTADELEPELRERILAYNWLDVELYRLALESDEREQAA